MRYQKPNNHPNLQKQPNRVRNLFEVRVPFWLLTVINCAANMLVAPSSTCNAIVLARVQHQQRQQQELGRTSMVSAVRVMARGCATSRILRVMARGCATNRLCIWFIPARFLVLWCPWCVLARDKSRQMHCRQQQQQQQTQRATTSGAVGACANNVAVSQLIAHICNLIVTGLHGGVR